MNKTLIILVLSLILLAGCGTTKQVDKRDLSEQNLEPIIPKLDLTRVDITEHQEGDVKEGYEIVLSCTKLTTIKVKKVYNDRVLFGFDDVTVTINIGDYTSQLENKCNTVLYVKGITPDGKVTVAFGSYENIYI